MQSKSGLMSPRGKWKRIKDDRYDRSLTTSSAEQLSFRCSKIEKTFVFRHHFLLSFLSLFFLPLPRFFPLHSRRSLGKSSPSIKKKGKVRSFSFGPKGSPEITLRRTISRYREFDFEPDERRAISSSSGPFVKFSQIF